MAKRKTAISSTGVNTNYGIGFLENGLAISYFGDVVNGVLDRLNATIETPSTYKGKRITRPNTTSKWSLV